MEGSNSVFPPEDREELHSTHAVCNIPVYRPGRTDWSPLLSLKRRDTTFTSGVVHFLFPLLVRYCMTGDSKMKLTANGIDIHYTIEGEGPVVTMSHALGCNLSLWDEQAQALRVRYRVLR